MYRPWPSLAPGLISITHHLRKAWACAVYSDVPSVGAAIDHPD